MSDKAKALQERDGSTSIRRVLAAFFAVAGSVLFFFSIRSYGGDWHIFIPGIACLSATIGLLLFTTASEISGIIKAVKGE